jgi:ADP-heptose:LPS heptosyltransferase
VVFVGDQPDRAVAETICRRMTAPAVNLCGRTTLPQLAVILSRSLLAVVNDSAPMHLASYLDVPVLALFGPTDPRAYGPWSKKSLLVERKAACPACRRERGGGPHQCMGAISVGEVLNSFELTGDGVVFHPGADV